MRPMAFEQTAIHSTQPERCDECPFCPGNEAQTSQERYRINDPNGQWVTRTIQNKFPALTEGIIPDSNDDFFQNKTGGFGIHEVIIDTPKHNQTPPNFTGKELENLIHTYLHRYRAHEKHPHVRHIVIFKNHGRNAGASIIHPHSQLIATPIISNEINARLTNAQKYYAETKRCLMCDMIEHELQKNQRIVCQNEHFVAFIPYAASSSFQAWVVPREHQTHFSCLKSNQIPTLAQILKKLLKSQERILHSPDFNWVIHSAHMKTNKNALHWYMAITPRLTKTAGFELGSQIHINPSLPENDAAQMRQTLDTTT